MIYKLFNNEKQFVQIVIDKMKLFSALQADEKYLIDCLQLGLSDRLLAPIWNDKVEGEFEKLPLYPKADQVPDIFVWSGSSLIMTDYAHAGLKLALADYGEFLPVSIQGNLFYIFHILAVVSVDKERSQFEAPHGSATKTIELVFDSVGLENKELFRSFYDGLGGIFCTEAFMKTCQELGLNGLIFEEDIAKDITSE